MVIELEGFHTTWCTQSMYASTVRAFEMGFVGLKEKKTLRVCSSFCKVLLQRQPSMRHSSRAVRETSPQPFCFALGTLLVKEDA